MADEELNKSADLSDIKDTAESGSNNNSISSSSTKHQGNDSTTNSQGHISSQKVRTGKRIAVVTGASSGMGKQFAIKIAKKHHLDLDEMWLISRSEKALEAVAITLDIKSKIIPADLTSRDDIKTIQNILATEQPNVVYLVNAAGFGKFGTYKTIPEDMIDSMIDLNCRAVVDMTHTCLKYMHRGSHIIQIASAAGFVPLPHMNVYAATKAFVVSYTKALRWELHFKGITATALCPTWVKTGFEKVARKTNSPHAVRHLLGAQSASFVVDWALCANKLHACVTTASPQAFLLRLIGKIVPDCITMAGWEVIRNI